MHDLMHDRLPYELQKRILSFIPAHCATEVLLHATLIGLSRRPRWIEPRHLYNIRCHRLCFVGP